MTLKISGTICPNDYAWYYDFFGMDYTCPDNVASAIRDAGGDTLNVEINSPGGEIASGSEIYTMLRDYDNVDIKITGQACSAASVIAMAGHCVMSPTALMMVHCVSSQISGNHNDMEKMAEVLETADHALCHAYMDKTGMSESEAIDMMEAETWLTAEKAVEYGLVDGIMFDEDTGDVDAPDMVAGLFGLPTKKQLDDARRQMPGIRFTGTELMVTAGQAANDMNEWKKAVEKISENAATIRKCDEAAARFEALLDKEI